MRKYLGGVGGLRGEEAHEAFDGGADVIEDEGGGDAEGDGGEGEGGENPFFGTGEGRDVVVFGFGGAHVDALKSPEEDRGGEDDRAGGEDSKPEEGDEGDAAGVVVDEGVRVGGGEGAEENHELSDEAAETGEPDGGEEADDGPTGIGGHLGPNAAETRDVAVVGAVFKYAGDEVEHGEGDAGGDHLEESSGGGEGRNHGESEEDVAHLANRCGGDETFEVFLPGRHECSIEEGGDGEGAEVEGSVRGLNGEEGVGDADEAVEAGVESDRGKNHRDGGGGGDLGIGEPGVEGDEGGANDESGDEEPEGDLCEVEGGTAVGEIGFNERIGGEFEEVEDGGGIVAHALGVAIESDDGDQEGDGTEQHIDEEFKSGIFLAGAAPLADEEIEGDGGEREEEVEEEQVERDKDADDGGEQKEKCCEIGFGEAGDAIRGPAGECDDGCGE